MKLGRNDPCHCGSGKKYKYCHYEADRAAEAKALKEAAEARAAEARDAADDANEDESEQQGRPDDRHHEGSRFFRETRHGGAKSQSSGGGAGHSPRATRGSQRGS